jgi:hypothetical protein
MLKIRKEQVEVFEQAAVRNFEEQMVQHLKEFAPRHSEIIGESGVRQVIRLGLERAAKYGLTNRGPVRFYIELMFMFGSDFDTDPQLPWAGAPLGAAEPADQMSRADQLYNRAMDYFDKVVGPKYEYEVAALRRVSQLRLETLPVLSPGFPDQAVERLKVLYPQKCEYIGEPRLRLLIQRGIRLAQSYAVSGGAGDALLIGLMFSFGHGCATDPQFPWIKATLDDATVSDHNERVKRLYSKLTNYLDRGLAYLERR